MVITLDFESSNPGSNPGRTSFFLSHFGKKLNVLQISLLSIIGRLAQLVEHWSNKPRVAGSSPVVTILFKFFTKVFYELKC